MALLPGVAEGHQIIGVPGTLTVSLAGDHVTIGNLEGTVREVGPVATIVETEEDGLLNRRSIPNNKMLNEAVR